MPKLTDFINPEDFARFLSGSPNESEQAQSIQNVEPLAQILEASIPEGMDGEIPVHHVIRVVLVALDHYLRNGVAHA